MSDPTFGDERPAWQVPERCRPARPIPRSPEDVGFAPFAGACRSRAGRWRTVHERDRDGRCVWCDSEAGT